METPDNSLTTRQPEEQPAPTMVRSYAGQHTAHGTTVEVWSTDQDCSSVGCKKLLLRLDSGLTSGDVAALDWGAPGPGSAHLAFNMLADYTGDNDYPQALHALFEADFIDLLLKMERDTADGPPTHENAGASGSGAHV